MAAYIPLSHSPRVSERASPRIQAGNPMTPVHSPHHSVTSSASSRTPIHTLTIHEYRKQQQTPNLQKATPSGRTLRRKAAASVLSDTERVSSVTRASRSGSGSSLRPLHFSQSAQQLASSQSPFQQQTLPGLSFRSQSAEPRAQAGSISSISTANLSGKVRYFNSRKRLPRPPAATGPVSFPLPLANVKSTQLRRSPLPAALSFSTEKSHSSDAQTTPTPSTFSLSRFPQPPFFDDPSFSPPRDEGELRRINALSFTTTAPATPPATPATLHYRGASFDLVNPHDSLLLHDIVTPSKDFDSSDFLLLRSSEEPSIASSDMAPKRALYGDFGAAHAGIMRRAEDSFGEPDVDLPSPPTPAVVSPNSSSYTSPMYSPEYIDVPSPLIIKKPADDSRFSLRQLTRTLTKKLGKGPASNQEEELQDMRDMRDSSVSIASVSMDGEYPRPLTQTYLATPKASYLPTSPVSPVTPTSPTSPEGFGALSQEEHEVELSRRRSTKHHGAKPLTSLIPDDPSTQQGRMDDSSFPTSEEVPLSKPYYDDIDSIYRSSSVYTGDDRHNSHYQRSLVSNRQSNPFARYTGMDASDFANMYNRDSLYGYGSTHGSSHQMSRPLTRDMYHHSMDQGDPKTDTISKFIDHYNPDDMANTSLATQHGQPHEDVTPDSDTFEEESMTYQPQAARVRSGLSQFEFDLRQNGRHSCDDDLAIPIQHVPVRRPKMGQYVGSPPREAAPLAPAFEYDDAPFIASRPDVSEMFSNGSAYSYGDTRNLLQISQSSAPVPQTLGPGLQPSSSYSQPGTKELEPSSSYSQPDNQVSPQTPRDALDQAEQIFQDAGIQQDGQDDAIPAMWAGRGSGSLIFSKKLTDQSSGDAQDPESATAVVEDDKADWETLGRPSGENRDSLGSIADYSSSEGTRNSLGVNSDGSLPSWPKQNYSRGPSYYGHPSPLRSHTHPFSSSPPGLKARVSVQTTPETSSPRRASNLPASTSTPAYRFTTRPEDVLGRGAVEEPYALTPWADPYAFSDKETQELLASGPNDNIIINNEPRSPGGRHRVSRHHEDRGVVPMSSSPESVFGSPVGLERENTFEKFSVVGPKGNLTGTPRGTGMHETGSSVADTSSPGLRMSSSVGRQSFRSDYPGFYASSFPAIGSVTRIRSSRPPPERDPQHERTPSQMTLFPSARGLEPVQETSPFPNTSHRQPLRASTTFQRARGMSRAAVPGQTRLRQMVLAPDGRATVSSQDTPLSRFMGGSERPSTSDTITPLRPSHNLSVDTFAARARARAVIAHQHSPHLLCLEREVNPEDEARRRKLSWFILAAFCLIPPCILLYRVWGDSIIISLTEGRLGHCTAQSKKAALIGGIVVNIGLATVILVPILVAHALKVV